MQSYNSSKSQSIVSSEPIESGNGDLDFFLFMGPEKWPIHVTSEALQDLARNNGKRQPETSLALFRAYADEIISVAIRSIEVQRAPKPIQISADISPWH